MPNLIMSEPIVVEDYGRVQIPDNDLKNISPIADKDIKTLIEKNDILLVFPHCLSSNNDGIDENGKRICTIQEEDGNFYLSASDIMGFVGCNGTELTIHSRFAKNDKDDYFLHYMVQKVLNINLFDLPHSSSQDKVFDFLVFLFPRCLKEALSQGMYKQYVVNKYNDTNVRGMIDVARHIKLNIPFAGKIAYNVREYSFDNNMTQLIRHTIEYIKANKMLSSILKRDDDIKGYVSQICQATPSYKMQDRNKIISKSLKLPTHPYYNKYINLQKLCVKILTHKKLKYGKDNNEIYGLLFSGSWLWEEYLYKAVLKDCGFTHGENITKKNPIYIFSGNSYVRYPDYYNDDFILDAKYKRLKDKEIARDDIHQVISYMYVQKAKKGGVIHPHSFTENQNIDLCRIGELNGYGGYIYRIGVPILDSAKNFTEFQEKMKELEHELRSKIRDL